MKRSELSTPDRVVLLLSVIPYLREHGPTSITELAEVFGVSPKLLRSLISFLGMAGIPGETATYQDEDLFDIDWAALEEHDVVSLTRTVAVEDTPRFSPLESAALLAGVLALRPMLPESQRATIDALGGKLRHASAATPTSGEASVSVAPDQVGTELSALLLAFREQRQVTFVYRDAKGERSERRVDPLLLHQTADDWYLRAWCVDREAERTFSLERMSGVVVTSVSTSHEPLRPQDFALFAPADQATGIAVEVMLTERGAAALAGFAPERVSAPDAAGWFTAVVQIGHPSVAVRLVQTLPGEVRVVRPDSAVQAVRVWAELALVAYDD